MNPTGIEKEYIISVSDFEIGATVTLPEGQGRFPAVLLAGGSMSHLRDGDLIMAADWTIPRKAMRNLAHYLAGIGIASIRWDKVGYGLSRLKTDRQAENHDHVEALHRSYEFMKEAPAIDGGRIIVAGESAGAYYTCLFAKAYRQPYAYMLLGGLCSSTETLFDFNYRRTVEYAQRSPDHLKWVETNAVKALAVGLHYEKMFQEARDGRSYYQMGYDGRNWSWYLPPLREQLEQDLLQLYRHLNRPVLVIQGENDMNVPPGDGEMIAKIIRGNNNPEVELAIIPGADHNFQQTPAAYEERLRERISLACLNNPYVNQFYQRIEQWLQRIIQ